MTPLLTPIHLISELSRVISLSMRLFGNVFAGEVLLATMLALTTATVFILPLAFVVPGVFIGLELLFGLVQALVFALLSMTYITLAIAEHREHGSDDQIRARRPSKAPRRPTARRKETGGSAPSAERKEDYHSWTYTHSQPAWPWGLAASAQALASASASARRWRRSVATPRRRRDLRALHPGSGAHRGDRHLCPRRLADHPLRQRGRTAMAFLRRLRGRRFKLGFQIINFLLLLYLLNRFLFKPVLALLDERQQRIARAWRTPRPPLVDRELASAEREAALAEARNEAQDHDCSRQQDRRGVAQRDRGRRPRRGREGRRTGAEEITPRRSGPWPSCGRRSSTWRLPAAGKLLRSEMDAGTQRKPGRAVPGRGPAEPDTARAG